MNTYEEKLTFVKIETALNADKSIIWLHGLGADGNDFVPIVPELNLPSTSKIKFIFPNAPVMPVTINNGYEMRAWFDIYSLSLQSKIDIDGIESSVKAIEHLIEQEIQSRIKTENIILAGFSQGAAIALYTGLRYPDRLGGIIALSGYLPLADKVLAAASQANSQIPVFLGHGTEDPIVPYALGKATYSALHQASYPVTWRSYPMPHSVCTEEIRDISLWLQNTWHA